MTTTTTSIARGKYHIWTVGCQMNQADSQRIQAILDELGWEETSMEQANLVILNTCSVRKAPEEKAHNQLALLKHAKEKRSDLLVAMMGCMIGNQKTIDELSKRYPHIDLFMKVEQADILPRFLEERWTPISGAGCLDVEFLPPGETIPVEPIERLLPTFATSTNTTGKRTVLPMAITPKPGERIAHYPTKIEEKLASPTAWLPVILGCNKVCTYCIVPYRRGRERSRPIDELVAEASTLVAKGAKELTLLGQTVEAYGLDLPGQPDLAELMKHLSEIDGLERIRFMTSYPRHMNDSMIERMAALPKVCEHVNIPVRLMNIAIALPACANSGPTSLSLPISSLASAARLRKSSSIRSICLKRFASTWCMSRPILCVPAQSRLVGRTIFPWPKRNAACTRLKTSRPASRLKSTSNMSVTSRR
jgi:tRNA-2-methylthio-N6-dimethylallyladenosine synthase